MAATTTAASDAPAEPHATSRPARRNDEIQGLRAVAALAVLVTHVSLNAMGNEGPFGGALARLDVGVAVFFVLSGYLLYRPFAAALLRDEPLPSLRRYFRHRLVRIVPAYWVVVLASFLFVPAVGLVLPTTNFSTAPIGVTEVPFAMLVKFLTFTQVYWQDSVAGPFPQAWTLAVEMSFYFAMPLLAWLIARRNRGDRAARLRRQWWALGGMVVVATAFRALTVLLADAYAPGSEASTNFAKYGAWLPNHLDLFAIGMAAAVLLVERTDRGPGAPLADRLESLFARRGAAGASVAVAFGTLLLAGYGLGLSRTDLSYGRVGEFLRHGSYAVIAAAMVAPAVFGRDGRSWYRSFLRTGPMQYLGKISYGIYLWQILVIGRWVSSPFTPGGPLPARNPGGQFNVPFWSTLAWTVVVTVALASITWYVVERPWLRFKDRKLGLFWGGVWAVSLASLATRIWSFGTSMRNNPGNGDPFYYHAQANMLADRVGFGEPIQWLTEGRFVPSAIHPPFFTIWLSPASFLGARDYLAHKTLAALGGVLVVVAAALLARRLAGDRAGVLAAIAVALAPNLVVIDGTLWPEGLYTAVVGFTLVLAYRWRDRPTWWRAAGLGALVGLSVLTRGEALLLLPLLCLPLVLSVRKTEAAWWKHGVVMGAAVGVVVAPWMIRNLVTYEEFVPISTNSDEVLVYANCDDTYFGGLPGYWSFACQERLRAERVAEGLPADPPGDESERAAGWGEYGREYISEHRDRVPRVVAQRILRGWDLRYSESNLDALQIEGRPRGWSENGLWYYRLSIVAGIAGLVVLRRRRVPIWPLLSMLAMITVTFAAVYGHVRFRTVGDFVLLVASAIAVDAWWSWLRRRADAADADADADAAAGGEADAGEDAALAPASTSGGRWGMGRADWRSIVSLGLVVVALLLPMRALLRYQGPPMEEGFMLVFPERILNGDLPHKDFLHLYGPGSLYALAAWFKVFGVSLTAERIFGFLQLAGIVFGMMALTWSWGRRVATATGLFGVLLTMTAIGLTALAWDGAVAFLVFSVWAGLRARRWRSEPPDPLPDGPSPQRRAQRLLVVSGVLAGLALLFRPDVIVAVGLGTLGLLAGWPTGDGQRVERPRGIRGLLARFLPWEPLKWWLAGGVPTLSLYLAHLVASGPGNVIQGMLIEPVFELRGGRSLPRPPSWDTFDGALQKVALLRPQPWSLPTLESPQQAFVWFFLLPAVTAFVVGVGWWRVRAEPGRWQARVVLTVGLVGVGLLPQAFQRADTTHLAWVSCVTFAFLPAAVAEVLAHQRRAPVLRRWAPTWAAVAVAVIPMVVIPHFTGRIYLDLVKQSRSGDVYGYPVTYGGRTFYLGAQDIAPVAQRMLTEIGPQMAPGEKLFVGTADLRKTPYSDAYLYYLLPDQVPGTRYIEMDPGMANAPDSGMADEVAASDWLILSHVWDAWDEPNESRELGSNEPNEVVDRDFCPVGDFAPYFEVYRRCE